MKLNLAGRITVLASATLFTACGDDAKPTTDTTVQTDVTVNTDTAVEDDTMVMDDTMEDHDMHVMEDVAVVEDTTVEDDVAVVEDTTIVEDTGPSPCDAGDGPVFAVSASSFDDYTINGELDPAITVVRGCTYTFNVTAGGAHPFRINSVQGPGSANSYDDGVTGNGTGTGTITWVVGESAPASLFYNCENHSAMTGPITVIAPAN